MVLLVVLLVFLYLVLSGLLSAWTLWLTGYWYSEPTPNIEWRGPAAGGVVFAVLLLWVVLAYRAPGTYGPLWEFSSREVSKPFPDVFAPLAEGGEAERFRWIPGRGYRLNGRENLKPLPSRPAYVEVRGDQKAKFEPERDAKGKLLIRKNKSLFASQDEPLRYLDEGGRVMLEESLGQVTTFKTGNFVMNLLLNALLLAALFAALWPVLRFQPWHALGQALVLWLVMTLFVVPPLLSQTEAVARAKPGG